MPEPIRTPIERRPEQPLTQPERESRESEEPREGVELPPTREESAPAPVEPVRAPVAPPTVALPPKSEMLQRVEKILEEDLAQVYFLMNAEEQSRFKEKGEETANAIESLLAQARASAVKLIQLLKAWFQLIPGVSKFFVERESKIKTDKLLRLQRK